MADLYIPPGLQDIARLRQQPDYDWKPVIEEQKFLERKLRACAPPVVRKPAGGIEDARMRIRDALADFLANEFPAKMLLIQTSPGTGKTTATVAAAEAMARAGKRVAYAGPRHDFYLDLMSKATDPGLWYEWLPRQIGDEDAGKPQTCRYAGQIGQWLYKGYEAMQFCSGVCGWDYVKDGCPYHKQKKNRAPIIYIQHQHVPLGHPLQFDVLFGDESPLAAFANEWRIPAAWVLPPGMPYDDPMTHLLDHLGKICGQTAYPVMGPDLVEALGGPDEVIQSCERFEAPLESVEAWGSLHHAEEVDQTPYFHIFQTAALLLREARQAKAGLRYPQRVIASGGHLTLLLRRTPNEENLPAHIVWLDATGRPELYEKVFKRPVEVLDARPKLYGKIYQVVDRANGKNELEKAAKAGQAKKLIEQIVKRYGYQRPSVIGFKSFVENAELDDGYKTSHFYAARGTNGHEEADAVFVVGAPQPNFYSVVTMAKMLYFERDAAFDTTWCAKEAVYQYVDKDGLGRSYPVSGFWRDSDLQTVLEITREDEMIQAAHRGRPVNHETDIWLLTNLPITALPPDELLSMREIMGAPDGVNVFKWEQVLELLEDRDQVTRSDIETLGFNYETASRYLEKIAELPGWELAAVRSIRGKPTWQATRRNPIIADCTINT